MSFPFLLDRFHALACVALTLCLAACQTPQKPSWELPAGAKSLQVNGYPMAYVERGTGPAVVLVHGALNDYRTWTPQMEALASRFRVVALSLRHYYPEPWKGAGEFSLVGHAKDVAAFVDALGAGPVALVGWSRGGAVAMEAAKLRPDRIRRLVLMDPALFALLPQPPGAAAEDPRVKRAKAAHEYFKRGDIDGGLEFFVDDVSGPGTWKAMPEAQRALRRQNAWTIVGQLGDAETVTCADVSRLRMPVLLMEGEQSPPLFKRVRSAAHQCLPAAKLVTVPKAAHSMHTMNPAAFNAELVKFLAD
jgi:pimeloyl-ACP methyl ester carboxylesterase